MYGSGPGVVDGSIYSDTGLQTDTEYFYIVRAVYPNGYEGPMGPEYSDTPNNSSVPWDSADPNVIMAKCDQVPPGEWIAEAPGTAYGPNGVGYTRHSFYGFATVVAASPERNAGGGTDVSGQTIETGSPRLLRRVGGREVVVQPSREGAVWRLRLTRSGELESMERIVHTSRNAVGSVSY